MNYTTCVSLAAGTPDQMCHDMEAALALSKYAEIRLDFLEPSDIGRFLESASSKMDRLILTLRSPREGGRFEGTETDRIQFLEMAASYKPYLLDVEHNTLLSNPGLRGRLNTSILSSWHDFRGSSPAAQLRRRMVEMSKYSDWLKMVVTVESGRGAASILSMYAYKDKMNLVAFAMGEAGRFTRLCSMHLGCPFMYVSMGPPVAPGQYSLEEVRRLSGVM